MPLIKINIFKNELEPKQIEKLITKVTDVITEVTSEKLRDVTWVIINEIDNGHWGIGGRTLGLDDVQKVMAS